MELNSVEKFQLTLATLFAVLCAIYLVLISYFDVTTEAVAVGLKNANLLFDGKPLSMEYPPLTLLFISIPRLFSADPLGYTVTYVAMVFMFFAVGLQIVNLLAEKYQKDQKKMMLAYSVLVLILFEFVVDRHDIFPMAFTLIAIYCFVTKRYMWAFVFLSLGMMTKLYPAILFPIFLAPLLVNRDWKNTLTGIAAFMLVALGILAITLMIDPNMLSYFIDYHSGRPLQIESVAASLIYPFKMLGLTNAWIAFSYGSDNLMGSLPDAVASILTPLMLGLILFSCLLFLYLYNRFHNAETRSALFGLAIMFVILLFIIVGKVFSSQYILWIIPPLLFLFMTDIDKKIKHNLFWLTISIFVITQINFVYNIGYLGGGEYINDLGMMVILIRNILTIILMCYIGKTIYDMYRTTSSEKTTNDVYA